jgi:hypothetical protein
MAVLPHLTIPTNLVDRRTKYYSQASHLVRQHQSLYFYANTRIGHLRKKSRTFTKRWNFLWFLNLVFLLCFSLFIPVLLTSPTLFSYPYSYTLHFPSFYCVTIYCSPCNYSFCPFSSTLSPVLTSPSHRPSTCHHTVPLSYILNTHGQMGLHEINVSA